MWEVFLFGHFPAEFTTFSQKLDIHSIIIERSTLIILY